MPPVITITITHDPSTNSTNVNGPLDAQVLMLGLLEQAKVLVNQHVAKQAERLVQPATGLMVPKL